MQTGAGRLRDDGFEPLDEYTGGAEQIGPLWPEPYRSEVAQDDRMPGPAGTVWFVRSPWTSITLDDIFERLLWTWVDRDRVDHTTRLERIREAMAWDESQAQGWLARHPTEEAPPESEPPSPALRNELDQLLDRHSARLEQRLRDLGGQPRNGMFVAVPHKYELIVDDMTFQNVPLITDLIDEPTVRLYEAIQ